MTPLPGSGGGVTVPTVTTPTGTTPSTTLVPMNMSALPSQAQTALTKAIGIHNLTNHEILGTITIVYSSGNEYRGRTDDNGNIYSPGPITMEIDSKVMNDPRLLACVMLHEMAHVHLLTLTRRAGSLEGLEKINQEYYNCAVAAKEKYNIADHEYMANHIEYYREQLKQMLPLPKEEGDFYEWAIWSSLMDTDAFWELPRKTRHAYEKLIIPFKSQKK